MKKNPTNELAPAKSSLWPEWLVFALFTAAFITVSIFHEPWFDEAQSWQIAKCASIKDILFVLPHYEGHPPLWHLLLVIPAKLGVPYELGLKTVAAIPTLISVWLLLFRSPFPRPVRMLLPFNYFVFYQYGVVSRPYGLMLLAVILSAMSFADRNEKPWRFMLSLLLLCLCSAYGIILAGGICICWVIDIMHEHGWKITKALWKEHRVHALVALLIAALVLIAEIMPSSDAYGINNKSNVTSFPLRMIYTLFIILPDCFLIEAFYSMRSIKSLCLSADVYVLAGLLGAALCCLLFIIMKPKYRKYFFLPWVLIAVFMAVMYAYSHHIGIMAMLVLFVLWINGKPVPVLPKFVAHISITAKDVKTLLYLKKSFIALLLLIPLYWTVTASINDIHHPYFYSRGTAEFLSETGLSEAKIMSCWMENKPEDEEFTDENYFQYVCANFQHVAASVSAYFPYNISYTFNEQSDDMAYILHRRETPEENEAIFSQWHEQGAPDVLLGKVDLEAVFDGDVRLSDYAPVYKMESQGCSIWKSTYLGDEDYNYTYVYLRKDLLDDYGLTPLSVDPFLFGDVLVGSN